MPPRPPRTCRCLSAPATGLWRRFRPLLAARGPALRRPLGAQLGDRRFHRSRGPDRARASALGADGVGLNPLHALFDDRPGDCSPYSPNSRLFLNALYIDVEKIPGISARRRDAGMRWRRLRAGEIVDYVARRRIEMARAAIGIRGLQGRCDTERAGRNSRNSAAERGAAIVALRLLRGAAAQIQKAVVGMAGANGGSRMTPDAPDCARGADAAEIEFVEFVQWTADRQLAACQGSRATSSA